jgi:serine/threonine-protein kinase
MENLTGKRLGPYEITAPIGEGGMAAVYQAFEARDNRFVALKVLPPHVADSPQFAARFQQEAQVIARLQHPNILPVYEAGADAGYAYIAMPLVTGGTLATLLRGRPLPPRQTLRILAQVGSALDHAHSMGYVHRDVKPSNVLLDEAGNCLLMDFGLARVLARTVRITRSGAMLGTPQYMSPEQGRGERVDGRSDLYALGVMLYEMATGRVPYDGKTPVEVISQHIHEPVPPPRQRNPALPPAVEAVILKALAKRPDDRFQTAGALVEALREALVAGRPAPARPPEPPHLAPPAERRPIPPPAPAAPPRVGPPGGLTLWALGLGLAALLLLLCLAAVLVVGGGRLLGL